MKVECAYDVLAIWFIGLGLLSYDDIMYPYARRHQEAREALRRVGWDSAYKPQRNELLRAMELASTPAGVSR